MTRQEAIELLRELWNFLATPPEIDEAVNMAIETLEQEETLQNLTKPNKSDLISRQAAIDTVMGFMPSLTTPDGCGQFDREIFEAQEMFVDIGQALNKLPSAQPFTAEQIQTMQELESAQIEKAYELGKADRPKWIPCSERLPKEPRGNREIENYLTCDENGHIYIFSWANGWNCCFNSDGSLYKDQEIADIVAWMPLPEAYREDGEEE